jgi:hypothetical protein
MDNQKKYKTSIMIDGQKIIPSDVFDTGTSRFILMDILVEEGKIILKIMGLSGNFISKIIRIDYDIFSKLSPTDFENWMQKNS